MQTFAQRVGRSPLVFTLAFAALAACADDPASPVIPTVDRPNAAVGDMYFVTKKGGGTEVGTLRWAVAQTTTGGEFIKFSPDLAGDTIVLDSTLVIKHPILIEGPRDKGIAISGNGARRVIYIEPGLPSATTLRNLSIVKGNSGYLTEGGAGVLAASDVVFENVTLARNRGVNHAALFANTATLINTTVSGNVSDSSGAIRGDYSLTLINSTIAHNNKGGLTHGATTILRNSLIAFNGAGLNCRDTPQTMEYYGRNLATDWSCGDTSRVLVADAQIDSLRYNGGPGMTHALERESRAINGGKDCTVATDGRLVARDSTCDIGAFEFTNFTTAAVTPNVSAAVNPLDGWVTVTGVAKCSRDEQLDVGVVVKQEQKVGRATGIVQASDTIAVDCTTSGQVWAIALAPTSGIFGNGTAMVEVKTENTPRWVTPSSVSAPVKLYWGKR